MVKFLSPLVALGGLTLAAIAGLRPRDPYLDPMNLTIGQYAAMEKGGAAEVALIALGVAVLAVTAGLRSVRAPISGRPAWLLIAGGLALVISTVLPGAEIVALVALPAAGALLVGRLGIDEKWRPTARPLEWLTLAAGLGLATLTYSALPGDGNLIGLVEGTLLGVEALVTALLAVWTLQVGAHLRLRIPVNPSFRNLSLTRSK